MIKHIMRKTVYRNLDTETREMILQLFSKHHLVIFFCFLAMIFIYIFLPLILLIMVALCEIGELTTIFGYSVLTIYFVSVLLLFWREGGSFFIYLPILVSQKVYFWVYTRHGNALSKKEFKKIKNDYSELYDFISSQKCQGHCYSICFEILEVLKKGSIEFIAVRKYPFTVGCNGDDGRNYLIHVLYINNGWAFDTCSHRQYPVEELHKIYRAKIYRTFSFDEISSKSYEDFRTENEPLISKWCDNNDCSPFEDGEIA